jgi:hypothetical protein
MKDENYYLTPNEIFDNEIDDNKFVLLQMPNYCGV